MFENEEDDTQVEDPAVEEVEEGGEESPPAPAPTPAPADVTKATLAEVLAGEMPPWMSAALELDSKRPITAETLAGLDPEAKRVIAEVRRHAEGQLPAAKEREQALAQKEQELAARERMIGRAKADNIAWAKHPKIKEMLDGMVPEGEPPDPYSPEGVEYLAARKTHEQLSKFFETLQASEADLIEQHRQAEAEATAATQRDADIAYCEENADTFDDDEIFEGTKALMARGLPLRDAHEYAMAKVTASRQRSADQTTRDQALAVARARVAAGGRLPNGVPVTPPELRADKEALNEWWTKHPEAAKRDLAELQRGKGWRY